MKKKKVAKVKQATEVKLCINVKIPYHLTPVSIDEFVDELRIGFNEKAKEIADKWKTKVELVADQCNKVKKILLYREEIIDACRNYIVDTDAKKNEGRVAMTPEERDLLRRAIQARENIIARQVDWIEELTLKDT